MQEAERGASCGSGSGQASVNRQNAAGA